MPASLVKAPSVPASAATGYVVTFPRQAGIGPQNVQSVRTLDSGRVFLHCADEYGFTSWAMPAGAALPLYSDQTYPTGTAYL